MLLKMITSFVYIHSWLTMLDGTKWLHYLSSLLKAAGIVVDAISIQERPVLVHCSDGWDRTPQVIALAQLMLDSYYRTFEGFRSLIEVEFLQFGHKFADRCRSSTLNIDLNERCPVFLQFLDCVHQLVLQFPTEFEFNVHYLVIFFFLQSLCLHCFTYLSCTQNLGEIGSSHLFVSIWHLPIQYVSRAHPSACLRGHFIDLGVFRNRKA